MVNRPIELSPKLRQADSDIAAFEFGRSQGQQMNSHSWESRGIPVATGGEGVWHSAAAGENTTRLFLDNPAARTATLAILRLRGDWDAAHAMQEEVAGPGSPFFEAPYSGRLIDPATPEAKRIVSIDWGVTSVQGITTVTSRRRLIRTAKFPEKMTVQPEGITYNAESHIAVDKLSTFGLDIERLQDIDPKAANEVRLIIICGMLATRDIQRVHRAATGNISLEDFQPGARRVLRGEVMAMLAARQKMRQYGLSSNEVVDRLESQNMNRLQLPESIQAIQSEIDQPTGLLIPSTVTFYGERVLHRLERV